MSAGNRKSQGADSMQAENLIQRARSPSRKHDSVVVPSSRAGGEGDGAFDLSEQQIVNQKMAHNTSAKAMNKTMVNSSVMNPKEGEGKLDERLGAFELCSYSVESYPDEKITYAKFLDDNDPSLLLVVTYDEVSTTSYMKVMKIQQINEVADNGYDGRGSEYGKPSKPDMSLAPQSDEERPTTFSNVEEAPISNLKQQIIDN